MSTKARIAKLEATRRPGRCAVYVRQNEGESEDAAVARWMDAHPGEPDPRTTGQVGYIRHIIVDPNDTAERQGR